MPKNCLEEFLTDECSTCRHWGDGTDDRGIGCCAPFPIMTCKAFAKEFADGILEDVVAKENQHENKCNEERKGIMKMNKYMVYIDCGDRDDDVFKVAVPAGSEADAREWAEGNGEIIAVKKVNEDYRIDGGKVANALLDGGFKQYEIDFICRALERTGIIE